MRKLAATTEDKCALLRENAAFGGLDDTPLRALASPSQRRAFEAGELLFQNNGKADGFFVLCSGEVEILRSAPNGREQILHIIEAGEMCGEVPVFHGGRYPASARARSEVEALFVPSEPFYELATQQPQVLLEMMAMICMRMRHFASLISDLSLKDVNARLAAYLLKQADSQGRIRFDCPKSELASRLGTIPETVSRSLSRLKSAGALRGQGDALEVADSVALQAIAAGEPV